MKKTALILGVAFLFLSASLNAQTDSVPSVQTTTNTDKWNNHTPEEYVMLPMPDPLTTEKIFPVIGHYNLTAKDGAPADVTISLDETNKGIVWVEGLPQGRIKAYLKQSPGTYMIPVQKTADNKDLAEGVMIFDKEDNSLDVCIGCQYNSEDPGAVFASTEPVMDDQATAKSKKSTAKSKAKAPKTFKYSGTKIIETTASVMPMK